MKRILKGLMATAFVIGATVPMTYAATGANGWEYNIAHRLPITVNGQQISKPYELTAQDSKNTSAYFPVYYFNQALDKMGYSATWNGDAHTWAIQAKGVDASKVHVSSGNNGSQVTIAGGIGTGNTAITLNGTVIKKINTGVAKDPAGGDMTTYFPAYYINEVLKSLGASVSFSGQSGLEIQHTSQGSGITADGLQIRNYTISSTKTAPGKSVTVSGQLIDSSGNVISNGKLLLVGADSSNSGKFGYISGPNGQPTITDFPSVGTVQNGTISLPKSASATSSTGDVLTTDARGNFSFVVTDKADNEEASFSIYAAANGQVATAAPLKSDTITFQTLPTLKQLALGTTDAEAQDNSYTDLRGLTASSNTNSILYVDPQTTNGKTLVGQNLDYQINVGNGGTITKVADPDSSGNVSQELSMNQRGSSQSSISIHEVYNAADGTYTLTVPGQNGSITTSKGNPDLALYLSNQNPGDTHVSISSGSITSSADIYFMIQTTGGGSGGGNPGSPPVNTPAKTTFFNPVPASGQSTVNAVYGGTVNVSSNSPVTGGMWRVTNPSGTTASNVTLGTNHIGETATFAAHSSSGDYTFSYAKGGTVDSTGKYNLSPTSLSTDAGNLTVSPGSVPTSGGTVTVTNPNLPNGGTYTISGNLTSSWLGTPSGSTDIITVPNGASTGTYTVTYTEGNRTETGTFTVTQTKTVYINCPVGIHTFDITAGDTPVLSGSSTGLDGKTIEVKFTGRSGTSSAGIAYTNSVTVGNDGTFTFTTGMFTIEGNYDVNVNYDGSTLPLTGLNDIHVSEQSKVAKIVASSPTIKGSGPVSFTAEDVYGNPIPGALVQGYITSSNTNDGATLDYKGTVFTNSENSGFIPVQKLEANAQGVITIDYKQGTNGNAGDTDTITLQPNWSGKGSASSTYTYK